MAPLELEGRTLGEKHRHYNKLVAEAVSNNKKLEPGEFNSGENDLENLLKIDLACKRKDVTYILEVFKCEDTLYLSRAIKRSTWLITDPKYSHIINPKYLHDELFPHMISKAKNKLMLHIRLNLKDEIRCEEFYNYLKEINMEAALKWLPHCSVPFIENQITTQHENINSHLMKRLCERSITILEKYIKNSDYYVKRRAFKDSMFLLKTDTSKYLDILESVEPYHIPQIGAKYTEIIMKSCPQRIEDKFEIYATNLDVETLAKCLKKEHIKDFLYKQSAKLEDPTKHGLRYWFNFDNLKHFAKYMPKEGRFEFIKRFFIEKNKPEYETPEMLDDVFYCTMAKCASNDTRANNSANIYRWYRFAPFEEALQDIIKLIRAESNPVERVAMFGELLTCAGRNTRHQQALLKYYHDNHINEPFKFKIQFVNMFLTKTDTHRFNEETWKMLNKLFYSLEVYTESENKVQSCIEAIIVYKVIRDEDIPEVIMNKFVFNSLKSVQKKLNKGESEKVFGFLVDYQKSEIDKIIITNENDFTATVTLLNDMLSLMIDWKKELLDLPWVLEKIKELLKIRSDNYWSASLTTLYNKKRSWKKVLFKESIAMSPCDETCYNALKHDPALLSQNKSEVEKLKRQDNVSLRRLLCALRVHWPRTLATEWIDTYIARLDEAGGQKALVQGLCILTPLAQLTEILKKYAPADRKINWSEDEEILLNLRKQLAKNMSLSRPHPNLDVVLMYAKGDYLQFILPSLTAVLINLSTTRIRQQIPQIVNAPVSLQKHGIRLALSKLESQELRVILFEIWKKTKNPSIRAVVFKQIFQLLCKEKKPVAVENLWKILSALIDDLSPEENKTIYSLLEKVEKVPKHIRGKHFEKVYKFFKSLPPKSNCQNIVSSLWNRCGEMADLVAILDPEFVAEYLLELLDKQYHEDSFPGRETLAAYLLCSKDETTQMKKYNEILLPTLEKAISLWETKVKGKDWSRHNTKEVLKELSAYFQKCVLEQKMVFPTQLYTNIQNLLETRLPHDKNFLTLRRWTLFVGFVMAVEEHKSMLADMKVTEEDLKCSDYNNPSSKTTFNDFYIKGIPKFAKYFLQCLKEDSAQYFPSIYLLYADALRDAFEHVNKKVYLELLDTLIDITDWIPVYLMVIESLKKFYGDDEENTLVMQIREKIVANGSTEVKIHYYHALN